MIGLIMAGGKGTRMNLDGEKLLLKYKKPIILHVVDALKNSKSFTQILAITSPNSPKTKKLLKANNVDVFESSGIGYVEDLNLVLNTVNDSVFVTSGDIPLLDSEIVQKITSLYNSENTWTSILVTKKLLNSINVKSDISIIFENKQCSYTGISLVNSNDISSLEKINEHYIIIDDKRIALNLNTVNDYRLLCTT